MHDHPPHSASLRSQLNSLRSLVEVVVESYCLPRRRLPGSSEKCRRAWQTVAWETTPTCGAAGAAVITRYQNSKTSQGSGWIRNNKRNSKPNQGSGWNTPHGAHLINDHNTLQIVIINLRQHCTDLPSTSNGMNFDFIFCDKRFSSIMLCCCGAAFDVRTG